MTRRGRRYGIGKAWCLWWLFDVVDPLTWEGWKVVEAKAERCKLFGKWYSWWPFWKCWYKVVK